MSARDRARRYLVPVGADPDDPTGPHLAITRWFDRAGAWAHTYALCGLIVPQGELPPGTTIGCEACEDLRPDFERMLGGDPPELTAAEARAEVDRLATELYRAQDAVAFVVECCDIADREGRAVTTADVRDWLKGAQCARQDGLVIQAPPALGSDPA